MEREFTNVSYAKPLWNYAINVYSENKTMFLRYQDQNKLCVNDLIVLGFCQFAQLTPNLYWWQLENTINLRETIKQLRDLRNKASHSGLRTTILNVELECEKIDLNLIADQLRPSIRGVDIFEAYCHDHSITQKDQLKAFINVFGHNKGGLKPPL